jgi:hypothetical protein
VRVQTAAELRQGLNTGDVVPVTTAPFSEVVEATAWAAVVDARMRKRAVPNDSALDMAAEGDRTAALDC